MAIVKEKDEMLLQLSGLYREVADLIDEMNLLQCTEGETPEEKVTIQSLIAKVKDLEAEILILKSKHPEETTP